MFYEANLKCFFLIKNFYERKIMPLKWFFSTFSAKKAYYIHIK
ncbi:hypothetical protein MuYL_4007 [Mucilaginibacter xinganensis]|uniref:Uncharacterized protein n=1 Tax=Mucilaginibacter xinganensis TaxID=1234841 RepID=A0A223P1A1_9SPHI|nr:hypothetical protein MuYL_4007 [Mucilaginibacter xinganensis]